MCVGALGVEISFGFEVSSFRLQILGLGIGAYVGILGALLCEVAQGGCKTDVCVQGYGVLVLSVGNGGRDFASSAHQNRKHMNDFHLKWSKPGRDSGLCVQLSLGCG